MDFPIKVGPDYGVHPVGYVLDTHIPIVDLSLFKYFILFASKEDYYDMQKDTSKFFPRRCDECYRIRTGENAYSYFVARLITWKYHQTTQNISWKICLMTTYLIVFIYLSISGLHLLFISILIVLKHIFDIPFHISTKNGISHQPIQIEIWICHQLKVHTFLSITLCKTCSNWLNGVVSNKTECGGVKYIYL